jgi:23S rRNA pseudouridine1911/1915/1917 synthase
MEVSLTIASSEQGLRLDQFLTSHLSPITRARIQKWIKTGLVRVNSREQQANYRVRYGDQLLLTIPEPQDSYLEPEDIPLTILFEDPDLVVVNKPPGLIVHPGAGHQHGTLVHALLHHCPDLSGIGDVRRPGLVHRLDKETSGVLAVAKNDASHQELIRQFKDRLVSKRYLALVWGSFGVSAGVISQEIGRHPIERQKMSVHSRHGREAVTSWRQRQIYPGPFSLLELQLHTGRTHQIRVHLASAGHPVMGDKTYGGGERRLSKLPVPLQNLESLVQRQLLHAWQLGLTHPRTGENMRFTAPLAPDFQAVLDYLAIPQSPRPLGGEG